MRSGTWLITGAGGQLGTSLQRLAESRGIPCVAYPRSQLDITERETVARAISEVRPEVVVNTAAFTHVDRCENEPEAARRINAYGVEVLAECCAGRALLVHLSSEYVFSGEGCRPIAEDAPMAPRSVYGQTKAAGEDALRGSPCEHLIVRTQWLFGPGRNFVRTMLEASRVGQPLRVVEDQLGRPTSTRALAEGLAEVIGARLRGTVHLACEGVASWYDFACQIVASGARRGLTKDVYIEPVSSEAYPRPAVRPAYGVLGLERAREHGVRMPHWSRALEVYLDEEARVHA